MNIFKPKYNKFNNIILNVLNNHLDDDYKLEVELKKPEFELIKNKKENVDKLEENNDK